ncbi:Fe-S cluster assembly protein SufD [Candidatus Pelagibacter sp.]|nr:Fe-S cluster assembly protein SufD [Candidatus Pelagibacter sp.]
MLEQIKIDFEKTVKNLNLSDKKIELRKKSLENFIRKGFPNRRIEEWKFSDLNQIISSNIKDLSFFNKIVDHSNFDQSIMIKNFDHNKIIFINGLISKTDFQHEEKNNIEIIENDDLELITDTKNPLIHLNSAFKSSYLKIIIKKGYLLKKPLIIYHINNDQVSHKAINQRIDFVLENDSSLKIVNIFSEKSKNNFINIYNKFKLGKNSILKNYKIDFKINSNIKYLYDDIELDKNSISENFILSLGSKFIKNEINCNLNDKYSSAFINGVINLTDTQHHEIKTNVNHLAENTKSYQLIKSVLNDSSKGIYQGKIFVDPIAQKTDGYQLSKAILLSENSEFNGKPELEIYADDVKCSHGSTSGSLDEESIFYLMSRGISKNNAYKLLINGFLLDVVEKITDTEIKYLILELMGIKK